MELLWFNRNSSHWPEFIQCSKEKVHTKKIFSDSLRMERLLSVLDGDTKRVVSAISRNGLFYATTLKALKIEFGNSYAVSFFLASSTTKNSHYMVNINGVFFFY